MSCNCTITNCYTTGIISGNDSGGIAGTVAGLGRDGGTGNCTINNCYTTGGITQTYTYCGGIVGNFATTRCSIRNCYVTRIIDTTNNIDVAYIPLNILPEELATSVNDLKNINSENIIYFLLITPFEEKIVELDIRTLNSLINTNLLNSPN